MLALALTLFNRRPVATQAQPAPQPQAAGYGMAYGLKYGGN